MRCFSPIVAPRTRDIVRCGQCKGCIALTTSDRRARAEWHCFTTRSIPWFVTLTYAGSEPPNPEAAKVQRWLKRVRKVDPGKFKGYVMCPDWGSKTSRFHWHGLVWSDSGNPAEHWHEGFHLCQKMHTGVSYALRYSAKRMRLWRQHGLRMLASQKFGQHTTPELVAFIEDQSHEDEKVPQYYFNDILDKVSQIPQAVIESMMDATGWPRDTRSRKEFMQDGEETSERTAAEIFACPDASLGSPRTGVHTD